MKRPSIDAPSSVSSNSSNDGCSTSGTWKLSPSSPPVNSDSCEASVWNAAATASVIIAKKIAFTRRLNSPIASASSADSAQRARDAQRRPRPSSAPCACSAIATP